MSQPLERSLNPDIRRVKLENPIIFFDGVCGLCNRAVDQMIAWDRHEKFRYAPLQGTTATEIIPENIKEEVDSVILYHKGSLYLKSDAAIRSFSLLGGWRKIGLAGLILPRFLRNWVYDYIARNRYKWFEKKETCRLPSPEEKKLFLD